MPGLTQSLEKILYYFASYATLHGREGYSKALEQTLILPEPQRSEQLEILKASIVEILRIEDDDSEIKNFISKYGLSVKESNEFIDFLGKDSGFIPFNDSSDGFITLSSYLKTKLEERLYDKLILFIKFQFGHKYWDQVEYQEKNDENVNNVLVQIHGKSPVLAKFVHNQLLN